MTLEQLIEKLRRARIDYDYCGDQDCGQAMDDLIEVEDEIVTFVVQHADEMIAWEREHAVRTSPFDN